jgi:hypothetical protein
MKAATKLASLPFGELDRLVKAIGECKSKSEEDRIISAEVDVLKQRLSDPRLDKTRGREYMVSCYRCWFGECRPHLADGSSKWRMC